MLTRPTALSGADTYAPTFTTIDSAGRLFRRYPPSASRSALVQEPPNWEPGISQHQLPCEIPACLLLTSNTPRQLLTHTAWGFLGQFSITI